MREITVTVKFDSGLHARPVVQLIKTVSQFQAKIALTKEGNSVPADSITAILSACIIHGDEITVTAEGPDEVEAIEAMREFFS